jgi:hypothetical protein
MKPQSNTLKIFYEDFRSVFFSTNSKSVLATSVFFDEFSKVVKAKYFTKFSENPRRKPKNIFFEILQKIRTSNSFFAKIIYLFVFWHEIIALSNPLALSQI